MKVVKAFALGGLEEIGRHLFVFEIDQKIFLFNCGIKNLKNIDFGVSSLIPDFTYLQQNAQKIRGIFLTKIDAPQAAGLPFFLKSFPHVKIYCSPISYSILQSLPLLSDSQKENNLRILPKENLIFDDLELSSFSTASNTIGSCGYILADQNARVIFTGDFVIEGNLQTNFFQTDFSKVREEKNKPTLLLVSNVGKIDTPGFTVPHNYVNLWVKRAFQKTEQTLYIACYENDWYKIYNLFNFFTRQVPQPKMSFLDENYQKLFVSIFSQYVDKKFFENLVPITKLTRENGQKNIIFVTGDEKWLFSRILQLVNSPDPIKKITKKDYFLILGEHDFNNELSISNTINDLYHTPAQIQFISSRKIYSTEASAEDLKLMTTLVKPRYFFPFGARHSNLLYAKNLLVDVNFPANSIFLKKNGEVIKIVNGQISDKKEAVPAQNIYIDNLKTKSVPKEMIRDRIVISNNGIILIGFSFFKQNQRYSLSSNIDIEDHGVTADSLKTHRLHDKIIGQIQHHIHSMKKPLVQIERLKKDLKKKIEQTVFFEVKKKPFILFLISQE